MLLVLSLIITSVKAALGDSRESDTRSECLRFIARFANNRCHVST